MTNVETRMVAWRKNRRFEWLFASFEFRHSFVIRASAFVVWKLRGRPSRSARSGGAREAADTALEVEFQNAELILMGLNDVVQRVHHAFGRVKIHDDAMRQLDRVGGIGDHRRIQAEIEDQFFRRHADAAEIRVDGGQAAVVGRELRRSLCGRLRCGCGFFSHGRDSCMRYPEGRQYAVSSRWKKGSGSPDPFSTAV